jgi:hypothetical protein
VECLPFIRRGLPLRAYPQERLHIGRSLVLNHRSYKTEIYIGLDVHKETITAAVSEGGRIGELQALFARHNAGAALSAKAVFKPTKEFHTARHTLYSAEENMEIDKVVPIAASVKTKLGRGGTGED